MRNRGWSGCFGQSLWEYRTCPQVQVGGDTPQQADTEYDDEGGSDYTETEGDPAGDDAGTDVGGR